MQLSVSVQEVLLNFVLHFSGINVAGGLTMDTDQGSETEMALAKAS